MKPDHVVGKASAEEKALKFKWCVTYEITTDESAEIGEHAESGFVINGMDYATQSLDGEYLSVDEIKALQPEVSGGIDELHDFSSFSGSIRINAPSYLMNGYLVEAESEQNMITGDYRSETLHIEFPSAAYDESRWDHLEAVGRMIGRQAVWVLTTAAPPGKEGADTGISIFRWNPMHRSLVLIYLDEFIDFSQPETSAPPGIEVCADWLQTRYPNHQIKVTATWPHNKHNRWSTQ